MKSIQNAEAKDAANAESKDSFNKIAKVGVTHLNAFSAAKDKETFNDAANTAANKFNTFFGKLRGYRIHTTYRTIYRKEIVYHGQKLSITETYSSSRKVTVFHRKKISML